MDKINIYINSKNRDLSEQISNFTVRIPQNLLRLSQGEYFTLNVNGFYCYNSWFNCIDNFNNTQEFQGDNTQISMFKEMKASFMERLKKALEEESFVKDKNDAIQMFENFPGKEFMKTNVTLSAQDQKKFGISYGGRGPKSALQTRIGLDKNTGFS